MEGRAWAGVRLPTWPRLWAGFCGGWAAASNGLVWRMARRDGGVCAGGGQEAVD